MPMRSTVTLCKRWLRVLHLLAPLCQARLCLQAVGWLLHQLCVTALPPRRLCDSCGAVCQAQPRAWSYYIALASASVLAGAESGRGIGLRMRLVGGGQVNQLRRRWPQPFVAVTRARTQTCARSSPIIL